MSSSSSSSSHPDTVQVGELRFTMSADDDNFTRTTCSSLRQRAISEDAWHRHRQRAFAERRDCCDDVHCLAARRKLQEENRRLRLELEEARRTIRALEQQPGTSTAASGVLDDTECVASVASSDASTVKAGSRRTMMAIPPQERDDHETSSNRASRNGGKNKNPLSRIKSILSSSSSSSSSSRSKDVDERSLASGNSSQAQCSVSSSIPSEEEEHCNHNDDDMKTKKKKKKSQKRGMSAYAEQYLLRINSLSDSTADTDSETEPSDSRLAEF